MLLSDNFPARIAADYFYIDPQSLEVCHKIRNSTPMSHGDNCFNKRYAGKRAGRVVPAGYIGVRIRIDGFDYSERYYAIAWALLNHAWPKSVAGGSVLKNNGSVLDLAIGFLEEIPKSEIRQHVITDLGREGYRGINQNGAGYSSQLQVKGKRIHGGTYLTALEAALSYDSMVLKYFGSCGVTNKSLGLL